MAVYTRRLAALELPLDADGWTRLYEHRGPGTVILRDVVITSQGESAVSAIGLIVTPLVKTGQFTLLWLRDFGPTSIHFDLRQELLINEALDAYVDASGVSIAITAYVFDQ